ncbi:M28 family peptidase [Paenibacillus turicensis]|uniref:M28 family metallopeptidase n=1 Tax=Paenibacillus turicensis TaxID=160487 RepID=UPI003D2A069B
MNTCGTNKIIMAILALFFVFSLTLVGCQSSKSKPSEPMEVIKELTSNKMMGRLPGTEGNVKASEYVEKQFQLIGLKPFKGNSFKQSYQQDFFDPNKQKYMMKVKLKDGNSKEFKYGHDYVEQRVNFKFNNEADITFDINDVDLGEKILVLEDIKSFDMTKQQIQPQAILISTSNFKKLLPTESKEQPFYQISPDTYQWLYTHRDQIQKMQLSMELEQGAISVNNIVGLITGKQSQDQRRAIVISGHFDHVGWNTGKKEEIYRGAVDNASGVAAMLKLASLLQEDASKTPFESDLIFVAFNGEESHFQGSKNFVAQLGNTYDNVFNINLDCLGVVNGGKVVLDGEENDGLVNSMLDFFNEKGVSAIKSNIIGSDHLSFSAKGIPALTVTQEEYNFIHTKTDTLERIDEGMLTKMITIVHQYILKNEPTLAQLKEQVKTEQRVNSILSSEEEKYYDELEEQAKQERKNMKLGQYMYKGTKEKSLGVIKESEGYSTIDQIKKDFDKMIVLPSLANYVFDSARIRINWDNDKMLGFDSIEFNKKYEIQFNTQDIVDLFLTYRTKDNKALRVLLSKEKIQYLEGEGVTIATKTYGEQEYTIASTEKNIMLYTDIKIKDTTYFIQIYGEQFNISEQNGVKEEISILDWPKDESDQHIKFTHELPWKDIITKLGF